MAEKTEENNEVKAKSPKAVSNGTKVVSKAKKTSAKTTETGKTATKKTTTQKEKTNKTESGKEKKIEKTEDKNLEKAKENQDVEISIKKDEETLNYVGKVTKINKDINNKSTLNVEITNPDERLEENMQANCTVIIEKAENVVGLPVEAVQKDEEGKEYVDVVQDDGTAKQVYIKTGISDDYYVEITYGLNVGDSVQIVKSTTTVVNKNKGKDNNNINAVSEM